MKRVLPMDRCAAVVACVVIAFSVHATEYFVDVNRPDDSGDGLSEATAKHTIQAAVDLATSPGDVVTVLPGVYSEGGRAETGTELNRVYMPNPGITLRSRDGAAATHIVGAKDSVTAVDDFGNGPAAVRCVYAPANNIVVRGLTLRDGAGHAATAGENSRRADGGGFRTTSGYMTSIADCVVSNCAGVRGGACYGGRAFRCRITRNKASKKAGGTWLTHLKFCIIDGNGGANAAVVIGGTAVNCNIVRNDPSAGVSEAANIYNSIVLMNRVLAVETNCTFTASLLPEVVTNANGNLLYASIENCVTGASQYQFIAPVFSDYRLKDGCEAVGRGDARHLQLVAFPAGVDDGRDFAGNEIGGTVNAGAVQAVATPAGGGLQFGSKNVTVDGAGLFVKDDYIFSTTWPEQYRVVPVAPDGQAFWGYTQSGSGAPDVYRFPLPDDTTWMMPPQSGIYTNFLNFTANVITVDPDTSSGADYHTLQAAVDAAKSSAKTVIYAAEGVYDQDEGLAVGYGMTNRVTVLGSKQCRIVGAGIGKSIIKGASDPTDPAHDGTGRGPAAIRCVSLGASGSCLQGFTLTDGRGGYTGDGTENYDEHKAGCAILGGNMGSAYFLADCLITNCVGYRGVVYGGCTFRTTITDSLGLNGLVRYTRAVCCEMYGNRGTANNQADLAENCEAYMCSVVGASTSYQAAKPLPATNCLVRTTSSISASSQYGGVFVWDVESQVSASIPVTVADMQFADPAGGDLRLLTTSPAYGGGLWSDAVTFNYSPSIEGLPWAIRNGLPTPGARQSLVQGLVVTGGNGVSVSPAGTTALAAGASVTVVYDVSSSSRPVSGLRVNGEDVGWPGTAGSASWTFVAPASGKAAEPFTVEPIFSTNWYVNANAADDSGNGFRPETAKRRFHGEGGLFTDCQVAAGDCVHAAAGFYNSGEGDCNVSGHVSPNVAARCSVPAGVAVVADDGCENTFIVGADGTTGPVDFKGRGTNSVRCVYLRNRSSVSGFTLTGGRTCGDGTSNPDNYGGGMYAVDDTGIMADCVVSNNASSRGGGMHNGRAICCRFFDNWATKNRSAVSSGFIFGCIVDRNRGANATQNTKGISNCTFGPDNTDEAGTKATASLGYPYGYVANSIMCQGVTVDANTAVSFTNCIFVSVTDAQGKGSYFDCITTNAEALAMTEDYMPCIGTNPAVDAGSREILSTYLEGRNDVNGGQRIFNGAVDIGAVEADWRDVYAKVLGAGVAVTPATENVTLAVSGERVTLGDGDAIAGTWQSRGSGLKTTYSALAEVEGGGILSGAFTDAAGGTLASAEVSSGSDLISFRGKDLDVGFAFACEGGAGYVSAFGQEAHSAVFILR